MAPTFYDSSFRVFSSDKEGMVPRGIGLLFFSILVLSNLWAGDYTVVAGDTATSIARSAKITVALLEKANPTIVGERLKAGTQLYLPEAYMVKVGDTLYSLCKKWDLAVADVQQFNGLSSASGIHVGQVLYLPRTKKPSAIDEPAKTVLVPNRNAEVAPFWPVARKPQPEGDKLKSVTFGTSGEDFRSVSAGVVVYQGEFRGVGRVLLIQGQDETVFGYGNFEGSNLVFGQSVQKGQTLGSTSSRPSQKLSFFVYRKSEPLDVFTTKR